ncbi:Qat anti-phage system associated protein QatB [Lysobacter firmicutimachus]|uniref:Qat anti-phage system associated protein QatB n=1 Tax=Lysobacter firmicutimachus TaxID=1792846 RepID=A0AAU8N0U8_9GAMM
MRNGTGSARKAARRMGASRGVGSRLLQVIRDINSQGATAVLQRLNLGNLAGRPAGDVFVALVEGICPPGGRVDEAIARQALLDAIADLAEAGVGSIEEMSSEQLSEFFQDFVIRTIEGRVIADIGKHSIDLPETVDGVEKVQQQLHDFVAGCVRGHLGQHFDGLSEKTDQQVNELVDRIYEAAFELVSATAGDVE